jgi:hypothetical protein
MMKKLLPLALGLVLTLAPGRAQAALISANDPVYGANALTHDTVSGLDWLDLTQSVGLSINQILGGAGGFLANNFQVATLSQVEAMYTSGGWDGVDDSASVGNAAHLAFVTQMIALFGQVGTGADGPFTEGFAIAPDANRVARLFDTLVTPPGTLGRVACTTDGYITFTAVNTTAGCRADYDWAVNFSGTFLVRDAASVPEPATLVLLGSGLLAAAARRRARR